MPPADEPAPLKPLDQIIEEVGLYPREAFVFVQAGLSYTSQTIHGDPDDPEVSRHVSGQQLCEGLRQFALSQWGMMARTVLQRWNITTTYDFGRIVFALVDNSHMAKTENDTVDDFKNVFDFATAFDQGYKIECKS